MTKNKIYKPQSLLPVVFHKWPDWLLTSGPPTRQNQGQICANLKLPILPRDDRQARRVISRYTDCSFRFDEKVVINGRCAIILEVIEKYTHRIVDCFLPRATEPELETKVFKKRTDQKSHITRLSIDKNFASKQMLRIKHTSRNLQIKNELNVDIPTSELIFCSAHETLEYLS